MISAVGMGLRRWCHLVGLLLVTLTVHGVEHVCDMPTLAHPAFNAVCLAYFQRRYICSLSNKFSVTLVADLERQIGGHLAYCHYDDVTRRAQKMPIADEQFRTAFADHAQQHMQSKPGTDSKQSLISSHQVLTLVRPIEQRPSISITIVTMPDVRPSIDCRRTRHSMNLTKEFTVNDENWSQVEKMRVLDRKTVEDLLKFYAESVRYKTSHISGATYNEERAAARGDCVTDIAILIVIPDTKSELSHYEFRVAMSAHYADTMGEQVHEELDKINQLYASMSASEKLRHLLVTIVEQLELTDPLGYRTPTYHVPMWAQWVMGVCIALSATAAGVGHWISSKSRSSGGSLNGTNGQQHRSMMTGGPTPGGTQRTKQWAAGFAGGMWASNAN